MGLTKPTPQMPHILSYNPGVALYHHIPAQQPSGDVVLFGKAGEPHSGFNFPVLIRGHPESHSFVSPAVVSVKIFH